jgi:hypothetical protein
MSNQSAEVAAIRNALIADPEVGSLSDQLWIIPGDPWYIAGEVPDIAVRRSAVRVARQALPRVRIEDRVRLIPRILLADEALATMLRMLLRKEPLLEGVQIVDAGQHPPGPTQPWIGILVHQGVISLGGWVESQEAVALAEGLAWETKACRDVRNLIRHDLSGENGGHDDAALAAAATRLIRGHPVLNDQPIQVRVEGGEATLSGDVADGSQRHLAETLCWFVAPLQAVHNALEISGELT